MKAFVIKNKEGEYFCGFDYLAGINIFSERIIDALNTQTPTLKHCKEEIKSYHLKDCEAVKVTVAEGDSEQQLAEKDKEIEQLRKNMEFDTAYYIKELVNIRKQVCEEIYNFIMDNWEKLMGRQGRWQNFSGACIDLKEDLEKIAKNEYKKGE